MNRSSKLASVMVRLVVCLIILIISNIISVIFMIYSYNKNFKAGDNYKATVVDISRHSEREVTSYDEDGDSDTTTYITYKVNVIINKTQESKTIYQELDSKFANHVVKPGATIGVTMKNTDKTKIMEPVFLDTVDNCLTALIIIVIASVLTIIQPLFEGRFKYLSVVNIWVITWVIVVVICMLYEMLSTNHIIILNNLTIRMIH